MNNINGLSNTNNIDDKKRVAHSCGTCRTFLNEPKTTFEYSNPEQKPTLFEKSKLACKKTLLKVGTIAKHTGMPLAGELLDLSLMSDGQRAARIEANGGKILNSEQSREMLATLNMHEGDSGHTTPEQMQLQTVIFSKDSTISKAVNKNKALQNKVSDWVKNGAKENEHIGFNTADSGSFDLRMGLGFAKIVGLHKTSDNCVEGFVEDVYDFADSYSKGEKEESNFLKKVKSKTVQTINNIAVDLQDKGELQPYRCLIPIKVSIA